MSKTSKVCGKMVRDTNELGVASRVFNHSPQESETGGSQEFTASLVYTTEQAPGQPWLFRETLSQKMGIGGGGTDTTNLRKWQSPDQKDRPSGIIDFLCSHGRFL